MLEVNNFCTLLVKIPYLNEPTWDNHAPKKLTAMFDRAISAIILMKNKHKNKKQIKSSHAASKIKISMTANILSKLPILSAHLRYASPTTVTN